MLWMVNIYYLWYSGIYRSLIYFIVWREYLFLTLEWVLKSHPNVIMEHYYFLCMLGIRPRAYFMLLLTFFPSFFLFLIFFFETGRCHVVHAGLNFQSFCISLPSEYRNVHQSQPKLVFFFESYLLKRIWNSMIILWSFGLLATGPKSSWMESFLSPTSGWLLRHSQGTPGLHSTVLNLQCCPCVTLPSGVCFLDKRL